MEKYGFITAKQAEAAKKETLKLNNVPTKRNHDKYLSYFLDYCNQQIIDQFGAEVLYKGGLKIYTTLNEDMQAAAGNALKSLPSFYNDDTGLTQPQVALISLDPTNGAIRAMIGGRGQDKFNRATQAVRQPGSVFKPFVYLTAMDNGMNAATIIEDKEEEFAKDWKPQNYDKKWHGKISLRTALKKSYNIPTIKLAKEVGVEKVFSNAQKLGLTTLVESGKYSDINLSMALGGLSKGVTPIEMAAAYGTIGNNGTRSEERRVGKEC